MSSRQHFQNLISLLSTAIGNHSIKVDIRWMKTCKFNGNDYKLNTAHACYRKYEKRKLNMMDIGYQNKISDARLKYIT